MPESGAAGPREPRAAAFPKRLLIFRPTLGQGGADRVTLTLLERLPRDRFAPALALVRAEGAWLEHLPADVELHDLGAHSLWTAWLPLWRLLRRLRPDVLFSTSSGGNVVAVLAHRLAGRPGRCVLSERNMASHRHDTWKRRLLVRLKRRLYPLADHLTAVSHAVAEDLVDALGLDARRITMVSNPIVSGRLDEMAAMDIAHPWLSGEEALILNVGRLVEQKDHDTLLRALALVRRSHSARLLILGEGPRRRAIEELAAQLGVGDSVELAGFDENPFRYMSRCEVFALPSLVEGLPGALVQAMACGAAVVTTDFPGVEEVVVDRRTGLVVPRGDAAALAAAIVELLDSPDERRRLSAAGKEASARFRIEHVMPRYIAALLGEPREHTGRAA